jgi:colanic acid/amylovoran biosynthesis glycosyltransferase
VVHNHGSVRILGTVQTLDIMPPPTATPITNQEPLSPATTLRIAYLLSQYPAFSHTFFLQEVLGLRRLGLHIQTASINKPDRPIDQLPPAEAIEAKGTRYIKSGQALQIIRAILETCFSQPSVVLRGLRAVFSIDGLTMRERAFWLFYLAEAILVGRWMNKRRLPHLHVHFGGAVASVGMLASMAWKIPYSLTIHGPEELLSVDAYHLREKIEQAAFVFCISDFCRSQLCQLTSPEQWTKFTVVRLGVDPVMLSPASRPMDLPARKPSPTLELVCTGRLVPAKGHHILIEALAVLEQRGIQLHTTLIGAGPERKSLEALVKQHGLEEAVTFTSALSHEATLETLRRADIFTLASFAEGIPVALMEAMSLGLPCVSTTVAGIPELIRSGFDGILVPPANVAALADALEALVNDPALRRQLGSSGRQRIVADYNLPLNQKILAQCFEEKLSLSNKK